MRYLATVLLLASCEAAGDLNRLLARAASAQPEPDLLALVPARSVMAVTIDWPRASQHAAMRRGLEFDDLERMMREIGLDPAVLTSVVLFSDARSGPENGTGALFRLSSARPVSGWAPPGGWWQAERHGGRTLWRESTGESWLAALSGETWVVGSRTGVVASIEALQDERGGLLAGEALRTLAAHHRNRGQPVSAILALPQSGADMMSAGWEIASLTMNLAGVGPLAEIVGKLGSVKALGMGFAAEGPMVRTEISALMGSESAATLVSGTVRLMRAAASAMPAHQLSPADQQMQQAMRALQIGRQGAMVTIGMLLPEASVWP